MPKTKSKVNQIKQEETIKLIHIFLTEIIYVGFISKMGILVAKINIVKDAYREKGKEDRDRDRNTVNLCFFFKIT